MKHEKGEQDNTVSNIDIGTAVNWKIVVTKV